MTVLFWDVFGREHPVQVAESAQPCHCIKYMLTVIHLRIKGFKIRVLPNIGIEFPRKASTLLASVYGSAHVRNCTSYLSITVSQ